MAKVMVNGKIMDSDKALAMLKKPSVKVTKFSYSIPNEAKAQSPMKEPSHEGFPIDQDLISSMSEDMERMAAGTSKLTIEKSSKIMNRNFILYMYDPKALSWRQRLALRFL
jgi:hypothetical protein